MTAETETIDSQDYLNFLQELFDQIVFKSKGDFEILDTFLVNHLDKLNENLGEILYQWATNRLPNLERELAYTLAGASVIFGHCIEKFSFGNRKSNIEIAIRAYQSALQGFTPEIFPYEWAATQDCLGAAYLNRIAGEPEENLELAIIALTCALKVYDETKFSEQWALTQNKLGIAYWHRIAGNRQENLELAIIAFTSALRVYTEETFPELWAMTQFNLGNVYLGRIKGEKSENLELAIISYQYTLKVYPPETFPYEWAATQYILGSIFRERFQILGNVEDIQKAIAAYKNAVKVIKNIGTKEFLHVYLYSLGKALSQGGFYTEAIEKLQECQQVCQEQKKIYYLASTLFELAYLYHQTGKLEQARLYFKDSLRLFRRLQDEENIAVATIALGNLEIQIGQISQALNHLQEAKEYYQTKDNPERLKEINYLLGILQHA